MVALGILVISTQQRTDMSFLPAFCTLLISSREGRARTPDSVWRRGSRETAGTCSCPRSLGELLQRTSQPTQTVNSSEVTSQSLEDDSLVTCVYELALNS